MVYYAYITKITNLRPIPKADNLIVGECYNQEVVVGKDTVEGQMGIFFPADGRLSRGYLEANNLIRTVHPDGSRTGSFDANGKIRVQKLRGQRSNGYFAPLESLSYTGGNINLLNFSQELNEFNGVKFCEKYVAHHNPPPSSAKRTAEPRVTFKYFYRHRDTERLVYKLDQLKVGMKLVFTEKLHGTSQRSALALESKQSWYGALINGLCKKTLIKPTLTYKYVCGTRNTVIKDWVKFCGYYREKEGFRKEVHDLYFQDRLHPGEIIYYEIVGYTKDDSLIMPTGNTEKLQDKGFVKKYSNSMKFTYGCQRGQHEVYVYRISKVDENGVEIDYTNEELIRRCVELNVNFAPVLYGYTYDGDKDALVQKCVELSYGDSTLDNRHIKEGVVIRNDYSEWQAWKYKSFEFDVLEDNLKIDGVVDIEEES